MIIGLTGGIASGKSVVSDAFATLGIPIVDTDLISRELVEPGSEALSEVAQTFDGVLNDDGSLNRQSLREIVFQDETKRKELEAILHPRIRALAFERAHEQALCQPYVIMVVPLLFESGYEELLDRVLLVDCSEEQQMQRLMKRDGISAADAARIMAAQLTRQTRLSGADDIIRASDSMEHTLSQVRSLHAFYLDLAKP